MKKLYIIGSLRNFQIPITAHALRSRLPGVEIFDDWFAAGPEADDHWMAYEKSRGRTYTDAMAGYAANNVFNFDRTHLDAADGALLILPAGKSGHLELGYMAGKGKWTGILLDEAEPDRWDVMYRFTGKVFTNLDDVAQDVAVKVVEGERD